jgi:hypothetical protein
VTAVNISTGSRTEVQTTAAGDYTIPSLTAGTYNVTVEASGFKKLTSQNIVVQVAETERVDGKLEIGAATESIVVTGEAPLLKTENAQQAQNVSGDGINTLPINFGGGGGATGAARDPLAFITLSPGVQQTAGVGGPSSPNGGAAVNGFGNGTYRVYLDGLDETSGNANARANETQGSVEQIEEYTLQTSNFAPEFGQITGGMVNYTTRSGTNMLHGSLYEYFANEDLDAHRPYTYVNPVSRKNDFGGSLGGPIYIPKVYDGRDKTFFFLNMEEFINEASSAGIVGNMPTPAERIGDFSALLTATGNKTIGTDTAGNAILNQGIYDPASNYTQGGNILRTMFPNNVIPQSRLDPRRASAVWQRPAHRLAGVAQQPQQRAGLRHLYEPESRRTAIPGKSQLPLHRPHQAVGAESGGVDRRGSRPVRTGGALLFRLSLRTASRRTDELRPDVPAQREQVPLASRRILQHLQPDVFPESLNQQSARRHHHVKRRIDRRVRFHQRARRQPVLPAA